MRGHRARDHRHHGRARNRQLRAPARRERPRGAGAVPVTRSDHQAQLARLLREPALAALLGVLDGAGEETRVVGGAVRNTLLGDPVHEIDLATTATPYVV